MQPLKKEAMDTLAKLPDEADIDKIMYRLYVLNPLYLFVTPCSPGFANNAQPRLLLLSNAMLCIFLRFNFPRHPVAEPTFNIEMLNSASFVGWMLNDSYMI